MAGNTSEPQEVPSPKALGIGADLRRARVNANLSERAVAERLGHKNHLKVHRWETAATVPTPEDVAAYMVAVGAPAKDREELVQMTRTVGMSSIWISVNNSDDPERRRQVDALLELEAQAKIIVVVAPLLAAGLTQIAEYTQLILRAVGVPPGELARRVAERQGRRASTIMRRYNPAELVVYLDESVLHRTLGDAEVLAHQIEFLLELGKMPNVTIQVIPFTAPWSAAMETPFTVITAPDGSTVVYREDRLAGLFLHQEREVDAYKAALSSVERVAMSPAASAELIARMSPTKREETETT